VAALPRRLALHIDRPVVAAGAMIPVEAEHREKASRTVLRIELLTSRLATEGNTISRPARAAKHRATQRPCCAVIHATLQRPGILVR